MLMILLAVLGGVLTTLSMVVSSTLGKKIGLIQSTIIHYIGGLIGGVFILIGLGSKIAPSIAEMSNMPFYIFLGGVIGVNETTSVIYNICLNCAIHFLKKYNTYSCSIQLHEAL